MAYGGYGKNSPEYQPTTRPYEPAPVPTPRPSAPVPAPEPKPAEHCHKCGRGVTSEYLCCPYCRTDLVEVRKKRNARKCPCGSLREEDAQFCYNCGRPQS